MNPAELWRRLLYLLRRRKMNAELEEEMRLHAELRAGQLRQHGINPRDADYAARRSFGNSTLLREVSRETWSFVSLESIWRDLRLAARSLRHSPGFTLTAILTLALGIGANTAVFSMVDAVLLRPLPFPDPGKLGEVMFHFVAPDGQGGGDVVDGRTAELIRDQANAVEFGLFSLPSMVNIAAAGQAEAVRNERVSARFFQTLGVRPLFGREFSKQEDSAGGPKAAVISYALWRRVFHGDPSALDRPVMIKGEMYALVGVMPPDFRSIEMADIWTPLRPSTTGEGEGQNYGMIVRLKPGATWQQAAAQVRNVGKTRFAEKHDIPRNVSVELVPLPLQKALAEDSRTSLLLLWSAVAAVLLIACINIAGLLLVRGASRTREIGTRIALGGGRAQIVRQLLIESLVVAGLAGIAGVALGEAGIVALRQYVQTSLGLWQYIGLDLRVLLAAFAVTGLTSIFFGVYPAFQASRIDVRKALVESGARSVAGARSAWPRRLMIVCEVALSVMLLASAGLLVRSFLFLRNQPLGFDPHNVVAAAFPLQDARYDTSEKVNRLFSTALSRIRALPGVESAAAGLSLPYERGLNTGVVLPNKQSARTVLTYVTPDYFHVLRIPLLGGRAFTEADGSHARRAVIVNATFVKEYMRGVEPIGRALMQNRVAWTIVGVAGDVPMQGSMSGYAPVASMPVMFIPAAQAADDLMDLVHGWFSPSIVVRSAAPLKDTSAGILRAVQSVDPLLSFSGFRRISDIRSETLVQQSFQASLMAGIAALALLLAAIGIYGLIAQSVVDRTRELGIRIALGATTWRAMESVVRPGVLLAASGCVAGLIAARALASVLQHLIWGVRATDPNTFAISAFALLLVAAAASFIPALRIARLNAAETLRGD